MLERGSEDRGFNSRWGLDKVEKYLASAFRATSGQKARTAIDWAALGRIKRHGGLLSTLRALHWHFDTLSNSGWLSRRDCCEPFVFCLLARFAALGFVLQTLIVKKDLLPAGPNKILAAIYAFDSAIGIFAVSAELSLADEFHLWHDLGSLDRSLSLHVGGIDLLSNWLKGKAAGSPLPLRRLKQPPIVTDVVCKV
jgi:hypothetical protein